MVHMQWTAMHVYIIITRWNFPLQIQWLITISKYFQEACKGHLCEMKGSIPCEKSLWKTHEFFSYKFYYVPDIFTNVAMQPILESVVEALNSLCLLKGTDNTQDCTRSGHTVSHM